MRLARGDVWFVDFPNVGDKPALVLSWQPIHDALGAAIVARITSRTKRRSLPTAVELGAQEAGLSEPGYVLCHDLATIRVERFRRRCGALPSSRLGEVEAALRRALDLN